MLHIRKEVWQKYPSTTFGTMIMKGVTQKDPTPDFIRAKLELETTICKRFSGMDRKEMRSLFPFMHYHEYYKKFKKTYHVLHQCESIATGSRTLPAGAPLVQAMFMAEIKNQLLTAGYDCKNLAGPFQVGLADGTSSFVGMGQKECRPPEGDILFSSEHTLLGSIICGPDHDHRLQATTTDVLFAVYGVPGIAADRIEHHFEDIKNLVRLIDPRAEVDGLSVV